MPPKRNPTLEEIRARVAQRSAPAPQPPSPVEEEKPPEALAAASARFYGSVDQIIQSRAVQRIPIGHIAPDTRPEMRQPRLLPLPEDLLVDGEPAPEYRNLVAELRALGQSLKDRQIQPIIVYPGASNVYPAARYLILVGQRRWTSAHLVGLDALDAVVIDPPSPDERIYLQYDENEQRGDFSDMERAWALAQMRQVLGPNATWEDVEKRLRLSNARRNQLTRLLAFTPSQQHMVARLRLQETQIRPLHTAVRNNALPPTQVDAILQRLAEIAIEREAARDKDTHSDSAGGGSWRSSIDGPTIARLVARAQKQATVAPAQPTPRWLPVLREQLSRANQGLQRAHKRVEALSEDDAATLAAEIKQLRGSIDRIAEALGKHTRRS